MSNKLLQCIYYDNDKFFNLVFLFIILSRLYFRKFYSFFLPLILQANGFSNTFWGWGAEDDDFARRLDENHFKVYSTGCLQPLAV